jgi:aryl-alcohol dehydrogenase-like predicted oxidoreductase
MAAWEFQMLQNVAEKHGWHKFISMQGFYNLLYREEEREMIPYCQHTGVGLLPWSPLAAGVLAHEWDDRTDKREQTDVFLKALFRAPGQEQGAAKQIVERVGKVAKEKGISMAQVATAWVLGKKNCTPILGLDSLERIEQAVEAVGVTLTDEQIQFLEEPYIPKAAMTF